MPYKYFLYCIVPIAIVTVSIVTIHVVNVFSLSQAFFFFF